MGSSAKMGLQLVFSFMLLVLTGSVVGQHRQLKRFGNRPHDVAAVPDLDFVQNPEAEGQTPSPTSVVTPSLSEARPEQQSYHQPYYRPGPAFQTDFVSQQILTESEPQLQQYPVSSVQFGSVSSENKYKTNYGAENYYIKPTVSYYGIRLDKTRNYGG